jgi:hypothetical protein
MERGENVPKRGRKPREGKGGNRSMQGGGETARVPKEKDEWRVKEANGSIKNKC